MKIRALLFVALALSCTSCLLGRFAWYNFSNITDYRIFPSRPLPKALQPFHFVDGQRTHKYGKLNLHKIDSLVGKNNSVAFLIIHHDSIIFENYYQHYNAASPVASFSAAKSYTSALIGAAIADGFIKSVNDPITNYLSELKGKPGFDNVTIKHLLLMTSGIKANESYYNPLGQPAKLYYGRTLRNYIRHLKTDYKPGTKFAYRSVNTEILGFIIERATGKTVTDYLNEKIWKNLGAEYDASWSIDKKNNGIEKTFCCINARARDFAKFGRLYLKKGNWNGLQLLPAAWIEESTKPSTTDGGVRYYAYQWWLTHKGYEANGLHGQFIFICPEKDLVIVRLGTSEGKISWENLFDQVAEKI